VRHVALKARGVRQQMAQPDRRVVRIKRCEFRQVLRQAIVERESLRVAQAQNSHCADHFCD
jgi:hypothetical protein